MRRHAADLKATYNRIAEDWWRDHHDDDWWQPGVDEFSRRLKPGSVVVDVGCGAGQKTKYLLSKGFKVIGTDISEKLLAIAKHEAPGATYRVMDLYQLHTLPEHVDGLFLQAVLLHVPKQDVLTTMKSMIPLLNPGGCIYIAVKEQRTNGVAEEVKTENDYGYEYQRFFSYYTMEDIHGLMKTLQLTSIYEKIVHCPDTNWIQIIGQRTTSKYTRR